MARYTAAGVLDTTFNGTGRVMTPISDAVDGESVALQVDGKIVVGGYDYSFATSNYDFALARYNTNGTLDTTFGSGSGKLVTDFASGSVDQMYSVQTQADPNNPSLPKYIYVSGMSNGNLAIARYNASDGGLDTTFGAGGKVTTVAGAYGAARAAALGFQTIGANAGKIVVGGFDYTSNQFDFIAARYTAAGVLDTTFGSGGIADVDFGGASDQSQAMAVGADDSIILGGRSQSATSLNFAVAKLTPSGTLDPSFGNGGKLVTGMGIAGSLAQGMTIRPDGRIVVVGWADGSLAVTNYDFALAAYHPTNAVTVNNVAPTLTLSGQSSVNEGSPYTLALASSDPGADTISSWLINWGDGTTSTVAGNPSSATHTYADGPNAFTISAAATDEDGTYNANTLAVAVNNVAPTLAISGAATETNGTPYTLNLSSSDPGADTISSWLINWGDGTTSTVAGNPSSTIHTYGSSLVNFTITGTATDEDGTYSANSLSVAHVNTAPTVATAAAASPSPITGTTAALSVLGADDGGEPNLTYTWSTTGTPLAAVTFSANGTNAAKNSTATFTKAGTYNLRVTISDGSLSTTSSVTATVNQTVSTLAVAIGASTVTSGTTRQFAATAKDQFGGTITSPAITWSLAPGAQGTISATGLYTAPTITSDVSDSVIASSGSLSSQSTPVPVITTDEAVPPATNVYATASPEGAVVSWDQIGGGQPNIYRSVDGGAYSLLPYISMEYVPYAAAASGEHVSLTDTTTTTGQEVAYEVQAKGYDNAGNLVAGTASAPTPQVGWQEGAWVDTGYTVSPGIDNTTISDFGGSSSVTFASGVYRVVKVSGSVVQNGQPVTFGNHYGPTLTEADYETQSQLQLGTTDNIYHEANGTIGVYFDEGDTNQWDPSIQAGSDGPPTYKLQTLVDLQSLTVTDGSDASNSATNRYTPPAGSGTPTTPTRLYVAMDTSGSATVNLSTALISNDATSTQELSYVVGGANANPSFGNFMSNPSVTLTPANGNYDFPVTAFIDTNGDHVPDSGEQERTVDVHLFGVDVMFNNTADTSDDLVMLSTPAFGSDIPSNQPEVDVSTRLVGDAPQGMSITLDNPDGTLAFSTNGPSTTVTTQPTGTVATQPATQPFVLPTDGSVEHYSLFGISESLTLKSSGVRVTASIAGRVGGVVVGQKGVTVFWFKDAQIQAVPDNPYAWDAMDNALEPTNNTHNDAVSVKARATISMAGLDPTSRQIKNLEIGIVQNLESSTNTQDYDTPNASNWTNTFPGTQTPPVPSVIRATQTLNGPYNDASVNGQQLYGLDAGELVTPDGRWATIIDGPKDIFDLTKKTQVTQIGNDPNASAQLTYNIRPDGTLDDRFIDWVVVYDTSTKKVIAALRETAWSATVGTGANASKSVTVAPTDYIPADSPVLFGNLARNALPPITLSAVGDSTTTFTAPSP